MGRSTLFHCLSARGARSARAKERQDLLGAVQRWWRKEEQAAVDVDMAVRKDEVQHGSCQFSLACAIRTSLRSSPCSRENEIGRDSLDNSNPKHSKLLQIYTECPVPLTTTATETCLNTLDIEKQSAVVHASFGRSVRWTLLLSFGLSNFSTD